ncbi:hypothetical protein R3P38DRAFT_2987749, partial [Favolaschia claudopus]
MLLFLPILSIPIYLLTSIFDLSSTARLVTCLLHIRLRLLSHMYLVTESYRVAPSSLSLSLFPSRTSHPHSPGSVLVPATYPYPIHTRYANRYYAYLRLDTYLLRTSRVHFARLSRPILTHTSLLPAPLPSP